MNDTERRWNSVASSADGMRLVAAEDGGFVYTSKDGGATWSDPVGSRYWSSVASSADGKVLIAAEDRGKLYLGKVEGAATAIFNLATLSGASQAATTNAVKNAVISATSETCYTLDNSSVATLGTSGVSAPTSGINLLGGVAFNVTCTEAGGSSDVELALGDHYTDVSKLRAYKTSGTTLTDITNQVTFTNKDVDGVTKTVLSYHLVDGGDLDEDGLANGTIVDPIYIGEVTGAISADSTTSVGSLANTGSSIHLVTAIAGILLISAGIFWKRGSRTNKWAKSL